MYDATVVIQAKKDENLTSMLGVDVQERKCIDDWGDTDNTQISVLGDWVDRSVIYRDRVFSSDQHTKWELNLGVQPRYTFLYSWYSTGSLELR